MQLRTSTTHTMGKGTGKGGFV